MKLNCQEMFDQISSYVDDDLKEELCVQVRLHLKDCPDCQVFIDTLNNTLVLCAALPDEEMPGEVSHRLHSVLSLRQKQE